MRSPAVNDVDVLHVSPGTTAGWRRADAELRGALEELGVSVATCTSDYRWARHMRRTVLTTDLAEAAAMRRALTKALRLHRPRAVVYSSPQAAMLQPRRRLRGATAVRFDVPAALNRSGPGSGLLHALERRALAEVKVLLPIALEPREDAERALGLDTPSVALPIPVQIPEHVSEEREPIVLAYAGNPLKKGLDLAVQAWEQAAPAGWRLVVTGIEPGEGRTFLARRSLAEPPGTEWAGVLGPDDYAALVSRAIAFLGASRYEDYGLAQLEALAAGAMLVTVPSEGPYEALRLAREVGPSLVASDISAAALASALRAALELDDAERTAYARRAQELLRPYSRGELRERLRDEVLPLLLGRRE